MRRWLIVLCLSLAAFTARAAEDDRDFVTRFLEDSLSGYGRTVTIRGFRGALSSRATFDLLTIADDHGIWLTIEQGAISWNRTALLRGEVDVAELSAAKITLDRKPGKGTDKTSFEASAPFSLPKLPVSVNIGKLLTQELVIAEPVFGQPMRASIEGTANLSGGEGRAELALHRVDGGEGLLTFTGSFSNESREATIDLLAAEGPGGVAATLLGIPGAPKAQLAIHGAGPISSFVVDLALATDDQPRVTGQLRLNEAADGVQAFGLTLHGDISPLLQPEYRAFFGNKAQIEAEGSRRAGASTELTRLVIDSDGADLSGRLSLSATGLPTAAALTIRLGLADAEEMRLPLSGDPVFVRNGVLLLRFDARKGQSWDLSGDLGGLRSTSAVVGSVTLSGGGQILPATSDSKAQFSGRVAFAAADLALNDPALARAIGDTIGGHTEFLWQQGEAFALRELAVEAGDLGISGALSFRVKSFDVEGTGNLALRAADMARFSDLAGRPLGGSALIQMDGSAQIRSGAFDIVALATGTNLTIASEMTDRLLTGTSAIQLSAKRTATGITLRSADLAVSEMRAHADGTLSSVSRDLRARFDFSDLSVLGPGFAGGLMADATFSGPVGASVFDMTGQGTDLQLGSDLTAPVFRGRSDVTLRALETADGFALQSVLLKNPQGQVAVTGDAQGVLTMAGTLENLAILVPEFPGRAAIDGTARPTPSGYDLALAAKGPGSATVSVTGSAEPDLSRVDLAMRAAVQAGIINPLIAPRNITGNVTADLRLSGPPTPQGISGTVTLGNLRFSSPNENLAVTGGNATLRLQGGRADVTGSGSMRGGGEMGLAGSVTYSGAPIASLTVDLNRARFLAPNLYDSTLSGQITIDGPLGGGATIGGALTVKEAEILVGQANFSTAEIPGVTHLNDSAEARATRARAGVLPVGAAIQPGPVYALDLAISAPARIFVRGLGLDAELSGQTHLRGTTAEVRPQGEFELVRGRMNVLGKRFVLDDGRVQLLGSLIPYIEFAASTDSVGATATVTLEGPVNAPELHFTSTSGLPEEEIAAQLLFGDGLDDASAFQLLQLANAFAALSGAGGVDVSDKLRRRLKFDDLDLTVDDDGKVAVKAGRYLSDKVYSEASVSEEGKSQIDLNLNINQDLRLRGTVGTDGTSGVGIFFGTNY